MDSVAYRGEGGRIVTIPFSSGPLADDEVLVEHLAFALDTRPGGAAVGYVREVGSGLAGEADRLLDRLVALPALRSCGACLACRRGHAGLCTRAPEASTMVRHGRIPARLAVAFVPPAKGAPEDAPPFILAALGGVGLAAYAAVTRAAVEPNRACIILGGGSLAAFVAALVRHRGATPIRVVQPDDASGQQVELELSSHDLVGFGLPLIDARPISDARALRLARSGGIAVLCGHAATALAAADMELIAARALTIVAAGGAHPDLLPELCAFVAAGTLPLLPLCRRVDDSEAAALLLRSPEARLGDERVAIYAPAG